VSNVRPSPSRRILALALCYVLALQAFLTAFGGSVAAGQDESAFVICHGDGAVPPGDSQKHEKLACALCTLAAAASGPLPAAPPAPAVPPVAATRFALTGTVANFIPRPARAGLSRAPPSLA
jgi:hypothetical protein